MKEIPKAPKKKVNYLLLSLPVLLYSMIFLANSFFASLLPNYGFIGVVLLAVFFPFVILALIGPIIGIFFGAVVMFFNQKDDNWFKFGLLLFIGGIVTLLIMPIVDA